MRKEKKKIATKQAWKIIEQDDSMNQQEKEEAIKQLNEKGYLQKSCSQIIESNTHITELKPPSKHLSDEEIINK